MFLETEVAQPLLRTIFSSYHSLSLFLPACYMESSSHMVWLPLRCYDNDEPDSVMKIQGLCLVTRTNFIIMLRVFKFSYPKQCSYNHNPAYTNYIGIILASNSGEAQNTDIGTSKEESITTDESMNDS